MDNSDHPVLKIRNLVHKFGDRQVLTGANLDLQKNAVLCLVGSSGSGKTTLLRIIAGLIDPLSGEVYIGGKDASIIPTNQRDIGFVFQSELALFPHLSVFDNIAFPLRHGRKNGLGGRNGAKIKILVNSIIEETGLSAHRNSSIATLSGGLKQRVAIARALVYKPSILLLDEPLSSLDNKLKDEILTMMQLLHRSSDTSFLYVTHDDREVKRFATHIAVLCDGAIEQEGTAKEVLGNPATLNVKKVLDL